MVKKRDKDDVIFHEKRQDPRIGVEIEVTVKGVHTFFNGLTENISRGGVFIATHRIFPIGTEFDLFLKVEGREMNIHSKVKWVREKTPYLAEEVHPGMGLEFMGLDEESRAAIESFLRKKEPIFFDSE